MRTILRDCALVVLLFVGVGTPTHLAFEQSIDPCSTGEEPCNPNKPWMRGRTEKSCAAPEHVDRAKREYPGRIILACECKHTCDPTYEHAKETDGRRWDAKCQARCSPTNCACKHPCDEVR